MKFTHALALAASFAFFACGGDDDSSTGPSPETPSSSSKKIESQKFDCTVKDGVKVVYPTGGETFKMGDKITIIYGSDVKGSGYRFVFKTSEDDQGMDMLDESAGPESPDGKTCYEQEVVLSDDFAEPSDKAVIRVIPYEKQSKGANSKAFKVKD